MVIAAHPDDEILGVGATIKKKIDEGNEAKCFILGEGQASRFNDDKEMIQNAIGQLHEDTLKAAEVIGYSEVIFANFPDNRFDHVDLLDIVKAIESVIDTYKPDVIYTHYEGDLNIDHRLTFQAVITATRPIGNYSVKEIYSFETLSATEWNYSRTSCFKPNVFIDIKDTFNIKIKAMQYYKTELRIFPHPRSLKMIEIEAQRWGSFVGVEYVEAFELVRMIEN